MNKVFTESKGKLLFFFNFDVKTKFKKRCPFLYDVRFFFSFNVMKHGFAIRRRREPIFT